MSRCVIISGGEITDYERMSSYLEYDDFFIYCDSGIRHSQKLGREADLVVGDFDSSVRPNGVEVIILPKEKDDSDTLSACKEGIKRGYTDFLFLGCFGRRFDHSLANLYILEFLYEKNLRGKIVDDWGECEIVDREKKNISSRFPFFSLITTFGSCSGVYIENAKYTLSNATLNPSYQYAISNEVLGEEATCWVENGHLLLIRDFYS